MRGPLAASTGGVPLQEPCRRKRIVSDSGVADLRQRLRRGPSATTALAAVLHAGAAFGRTRHHTLTALAAPLPDAIDLTVQHPDDASCLEQLRDVVLGVFVRLRRPFRLLARACTIAFIVSALLFGWAALGLYFGIDNGWQAFDPRCVECARALGINLTRFDVPQCQGAFDEPNVCSANQRIFNASRKAIVIMYSYINFVPIPWRLAILHHAFCSRRPSHPGVDFYGRPTTALWFRLSSRTRRWISLLLNLAWSAHFAALSAHIVYDTYSLGASRNGLVAQSIPAYTSTLSLLGALALQRTAERRVVRAARRAAAQPPLPWRIWHLRLALRRWWANDGRLISCVRQEWAAFAARERAHHKQLLIHHQRDDVTGVGWLSEKFFLTAEQAALKLQAAARGMLCRMHTQLLLRLHHRSAVRIQSMWLGWQTRCRIVPQ